MTTMHTFSSTHTTRFLNAHPSVSVTLEPGMTLAEFEKIVILETLKRHCQNRTHTAKALGIGIRTLQRKIKQYGADFSPLAEATMLPSSHAMAPQAVAHFY